MMSNPYCRSLRMVRMEMHAARKKKEGPIWRLEDAASRKAEIHRGT